MSSSVNATNIPVASTSLPIIPSMSSVSVVARTTIYSGPSTTSSYNAVVPSISASIAVNDPSITPVPTVTPSPSVAATTMYYSWVLILIGLLMAFISTL